MTLVGIAIRNLRRNKVRVALTIFGIALSILTFVLLRTILAAWTHAVDYAAKDRIFTRHKLTIVMHMPRRYVDEVRRRPDVRVATYGTYFGATNPAREREFFMSLFIDPGSYFDVYPEIVLPPDQKQAFVKNRRSVIIGDKLAEKFGWKVGDRIALNCGIWSGDWTFDVAGIYTISGSSKSYDRATLLAHWEYWNEQVPPSSHKDGFGFMVSSAKPDTRPADLATGIDAYFGAQEVPTLSQDERAFHTSQLGTISAILSAFGAITVIILVIIGLILGNTIAMGVRERTKEYGVLRALGFRPGQILSLIVNESLALGLTGGLLGLALAYPIVQLGIGRAMEQNMGGMFPYVRIEPSIVVQALLVSLAVGAFAAVLPAWRASRLKTVDALRHVV